MKLYKDNTMKEEVTSIDFGRVRAGQSKDLTFYLFNDTFGEVEVLSYEFSKNSENIKVVKTPPTLKSNTGAEIIVRWSPSTTLKSGLKTVMIIYADEVYTTI